MKNLFKKRIDFPLSGTFTFASGGNAMDKKVNINQVEQLTGVSKRNIRFYEKEGLLTPERIRKMDIVVMTKQTFEEFN